jgi:hypothetical protein
MVSQRPGFLTHTLRHIALFVGATVLAGLVLFGGVLGARGIIGL